MQDYDDLKKQREELRKQKKLRTQEILENWDVDNNWEEGFKELYTIKRDFLGMGVLTQENLDNLPGCSRSAHNIYSNIQRSGMQDKCSSLLEKLATLNSEKLKCIEQNTDFLLENHARPEAIPTLAELLPTITEASNKIFQKNKGSTSKPFLQKIITFVNQFKENSQDDYRIESLIEMCLSKEQPQSILANLTILEQGLKQTRDCEVFRDLYGDLERFREVFPELMDTPKFTQNCIQHILPQIIGRKGVFGCHSNSWGSTAREKGIAAGVGISTFFYKCYATPITPRGINDLLQMNQENLASNMAKHEQIRADACHIGFLRDPVHDNVPGIGDLIGSMIEYYDAPTPENRAVLQKRLTHTPYWGDAVFDLQNYETVDYTNEKAIDVLRRLYNNMSKNTMEPPVTENTRLNELAQKANQSETMAIAQIFPLVKEFNQILLKAIDAQQVGLSPEAVELLAWTDKKLALTLNNMDFEHQMGFYQSEECREALLFSELTHSAKEDFNAKEFEEFYTNLVKNAFDMEQAYQNIGHRQNKNLFGLFKQYMEDCHAMGDTKHARTMTEARKERAGSGNTLKALQNLTLYRDASTKIGKKQLSERQERALYRDIYLKAYKEVQK